MTRRTAYTVNAATAEAIAREVGIKANFRGELAASFNGRTLEQTSSTTFELYASNADHAAFQRLIDKLTVADTKEAAAAPAGRHEAATERQISYLRSLIQRDPGAATTIGASRDGANVAPALTKADASRMIDLLRAGV